MYTFDYDDALHNGYDAYDFYEIGENGEYSRFTVYCENYWVFLYLLDMWNYYYFPVWYVEA